MSDNREVIQQKFEQCLLDGLTGQPVIAKDGTPVVDPSTGEILKDAPRDSFLGVVLNYIKYLNGDKPREKVPQTGQAKGMLASFEKKMPYGPRAN